MTITRLKFRKSYTAIYAAIAVALLILTILNLILGSVIIPLGELLASLTGSEAPKYVNDILWNFRIPKVITALLAGVALSVCGLQMQTMFRNPLADPYILGISSGAGLGVALFVMGSSAFGLSIAGGLFFNLGIAASAWAGAAGVTLIILLVSHRLRENSSLLIFGIMIGSVTSAIITLIQYFSSSSELKAFVTWTMGSFSGLTNSQIWILTLLVVPGIILSTYNIKELNILLQGETYAKSLGLNLQATRRRILIATTLLAGSVTAFCGPIGFIGIAVPHIARLFFKNADHKVLVPATALTGAAIMVLTDMVAQLPGQSGVIPINTVSALIGVPVILFIIMRSKFS
jgi:iron complex transport system permease protein